MENTDIVQHRINTRFAQTIRLAPSRRVPLARQEQVEKIVKGMKEQSIIWKSINSWSSSVVLFTKKDYFKLDDIINKDSCVLQDN